MSRNKGQHVKGVGFSLPITMLEELENKAKELRMPVSQLVRNILQDHLEANDGPSNFASL